MNRKILEIVEEAIKEASQNPNIIAIEVIEADSFAGYYLRLYSKEPDEYEAGVYRLEGLSDSDIEIHDEIDEMIKKAGFEWNHELYIFIRKNASLLDKINFIINNYGFKEGIQSIDKMPEELQKKQIIEIVEEKEDNKGKDIVYDVGDKYILEWQTYYYPVPNAKHVFQSGYIIIPKKYLI